MVRRCYPSQKLSFPLSEAQCMRYTCLGFYLFPRVAVPGLLIWGVISEIVYAGDLDTAAGRFITRALALLFITLAIAAYLQTWVVGPGHPMQFEELRVSTPIAGEGGSVPSTALDELAPLALADSVEAKYDGGIRFCTKCQCFKPDRAHHCRSCGLCILRMDHHCPWFSTCIGMNNHKFFVQFLWYVWLLCVSAGFVAGPLVYRFFSRETYLERFIGVNFVIFTMLSTSFNAVLLGFAGYTTYQVRANKTTIESMEPAPYRTSVPASQWRYKRAPDSRNLGNLYDVGTRANLEQVLGSTWAEWLLPIRANLRLNGTKFPVNEELRAQAEDRAQTEIAMHRRKQQWLEQQQAQLQDTGNTTNA